LPKPADIRHFYSLSPSQPAMTIRLSHVPATGNISHYADAIHRLRICDTRKVPTATMPDITNDMPEAGGGGASAAPGEPAAGPSDAPPPDPEPEPRRTPYRPVLITFSGLQELLQLGRTTVHEVTRQADFPAPIIVGRSKRWIRAEIDQWIEQRAAARKAGAR